jgi:hypothetical protein
MLVGYLLAKIGQSASSQCLVGVRLFLPCVGFLRKREWDLALNLFKKSSLDKFTLLLVKALF